MVHLVASAATSAIVASTVGTQTQSGSAKQAADASGGGGLFSELLAELLQDVQASLDGSQIAADPSQSVAPGTQDVNGSSTAKSADLANQPSSGDGQSNASSDTTGAQANWLAAWTALVQQMQQAQPAQTAGQSTVTSPFAALEALLDGQGTPANSNTSDPANGTRDTRTPSQDASLLAALQSLAAQFMPALQPGAQSALGTASTGTDGTAPVSAAATMPSNAQLAELFQTLTAEEAAMMGAQPGAAQDTDVSRQTADAAAATTAATQSNTPAPNARVPFAQVSQQALQQGAATPVAAAQAVPMHFGAGGSNAGSQGQSGQHGANANTSANAQSQSTTTGGASTDGTSGNSNLPTFLQVAHDQALSQQTNPSNAAPNDNAVNAVAAANAAQAPSQSQPVAGTLQVAPSTPSNVTPDVHALAVSIATQSQAGSKQFDIRLDPPELGRVDVRLTVDATGKAQAHLAVDKPQTLELLQKDSGNLARALKDSGVQLGNNGLQFSLKGQSRGGNGSRGSSSRGRSLAVTAVASNAPSTAASSSNFSVSASGVDIRV